jgi:hypothetical protein
MTSNEENKTGARLVWALSTPFILAIGLICLPLVPALCVFLDMRSRTYTGAVTLLAGSVALGWLLGPSAAAVFVFVCIATAGAYVLLRVRVPFHYGVLGAAGGGVLGAVALLGILGASLGKPINEAIAGAICNFMSGNTMADYLNVMVVSFSQNLQADNPIFKMMFGTFSQQVLDMSLADKIAIIKPVLEQYFSACIPAWALAGGMLTGGLGYYLPALAQDRLAKKPLDEKAGIVAVPPFHSTRFPKYIVISILLLQLVSYFGAGSSAMMALYVASNAVMTVLMTIQAIALFSFLLTRKHMPGILQFLILAPAALLFSWLLEFVGLFDVLFDLRSVALRVDAIKAKGKQVFTQGGLDELRKMGNSEKKNDKNGKDGEDEKK